MPSQLGRVAGIVSATLGRYARVVLTVVAALVTSCAIVFVLIIFSILLANLLK